SPAATYSGSRPSASTTMPAHSFNANESGEEARPSRGRARGAAGGRVLVPVVLVAIHIPHVPDMQASRAPADSPSPCGGLGPIGRAFLTINRQLPLLLTSGVTLVQA